MSNPKQPGVVGVTREDVQALIAENENLKMQLRIALRQAPSPNVETTRKAEPKHRDVVWLGTVLARDEMPTAAGAFLAMVGIIVAAWCMAFVGAGFTGANLRGAVMVGAAALAWWFVFARKPVR